MGGKCGYNGVAQVKEEEARCAETYLHKAADGVPLTGWALLVLLASAETTSVSSTRICSQPFQCPPSCINSGQSQCNMLTSPPQPLQDGDRTLEVTILVPPNWTLPQPLQDGDRTLEVRRLAAESLCNGLARDPFGRLQFAREGGIRCDQPAICRVHIHVIGSQQASPQTETRR
jgi:hypothetical protein